MSQKIGTDLTEGNVDKMLIKFAMPFLFAQILQALYSMADMLIVGQFMGDYGIAAVNNSATMTMFITMLVSGFALSGTVLVAQYSGAKQEENAKKTIGTIFTLFIFISIIITVAGLFMTDRLLNLLNTPPEAYTEAKNYLRVCFSGTIFICGYNAVSAILRGLGDSKRPLYFVAIATIANVFLDLLFVGAFKWGAGGAAFATVLAQGISFFLAVYTLYRGNFIFDFKLKSFKIDKSKLLPIFKIGLPAAVQSTVVNFSMLFVISNINTYGLAASTASGIGAKIDSFAVLPTVAMSQAIASMVGQNLGAGHIDRVKRTLFCGLRLSFLFGVIMFVFVRIFSGQIYGLFGCSEETIEVGYLYIKFVTICYLVNPVVFSVNGLATGSGNSFFAMCNAIANMIIARIPLIFLLTRIFNFGLKGIFIAMGASQFAGVISSAVFYLSGIWKKTIINKN